MYFLTCMPFWKPLCRFDASEQTGYLDQVPGAVGRLDAVESNVVCLRSLLERPRNRVVGMQDSKSEGCLEANHRRFTGGYSRNSGSGIDETLCYVV